VIGTPEQMRKRIERMATEAGATEVMLQDFLANSALRLRNYELLARVFDLPEL
jgi:alkanesulfonate monooxygenase SsuD/methylene tetrahydromethanopterin reductase-like flavin-dependent oxidoreductase (luciferase family)